MSDEPKKEPSELELAQTRLTQAALKQPMKNPLAAGLSAYVNGILHSARLDALVDLLVNDMGLKEAFVAKLIAATNAKAEQLEQQALQLELAQSAVDARTLIAKH